MSFCSTIMMSTAALNNGAEYMIVWSISQKATPILISSSPQRLLPLHETLKLLKLEIYKSLQIITQNFKCLIIQMQNYIVLFTLFTFSSVAEFAGLQKALNVQIFITDVHQELPKSCIFSWNLRESYKVRNF